MHERKAEMAELAESFNRMADRLQKQIGVLVGHNNEQKAVLASMAEGVLAVDSQERIISLNQALGRLLGLDQAGVAVHSGSSCSSEAIEPSPVLAAMGADAERSLRVSFGWSSTDADVDALLDALPRVLAGLRALRS